LGRTLFERSPGLEGRSNASIGSIRTKSAPMAAAAEATLTIAADPKRLGAKIGITSVLHSWGSAMTHHPHVHLIVPGGGISLDGTRWVSCRPRSRGRRTPRAAASMPLLWRPHDHHRDLRKRLPAETPPRARCSDQDRHLIMPSPPIHQLTDARHSGWLGQHSRRLPQVGKSARNDTANPVRQRPLRSFGPSPTPVLRGKTIGAGALTNLAQPDAAAKSP